MNFIEAIGSTQTKHQNQNYSNQQLERLLYSGDLL